MPRLYSYVVARDYGFAPNPFHGWCTLATCKPEIRRTAQVGDWVVGTGSATKRRADTLVYVMVVAETMTFDEYWTDSRFAAKRPDLRGSRKHQYGDNIYHHCGEVWAQADSHHSLPAGVSNVKNLVPDTKVDRILVSDRFTYWGGSGPTVACELTDWGGRWSLIRGGRGHVCKFPPDFVDTALVWLSPLLGHGFVDRPLDW